MPPKRTLRPSTTSSLGVRLDRRLRGPLGGPEVPLADRLALGQLVGGALERDLADLQHDGALGDGERHRRVLLDQHDRDALAVDLADHLGELLDDPRRQAERRLVEQQHARRGHQRAADREHLLLAAGQQRGALGPALAQDREQLVDARPRSVLVARRESARAQVLLDREGPEHAPALGNLHEPRARDVGRAAADEVAPGELDRPARDRAALGAQRPGQRAQQRRLAGAVAAQHGGHPAVGDLERDAAQRRTGARVAHVQVVDGQRGGHDRDLSSNSRHTSLLGGFGLSRGNVSGALI